MIGIHRMQRLGNSPGPMPQNDNTPPAAASTASTANPALADVGLLTPAEAAKRLGVGERVLERWRSTGDGPAFAKFTSRTLRYRIEDLEAFVSASVRRNTAE